MPTRIDSAFLRNTPHMLNPVTWCGDVDLVLTPAGPLTTYEDWAVGARSALLRFVVFGG